MEARARYLEAFFITPVTRWGTCKRTVGSGVFGKASKAISNPVYSDPIPVGTQDQVEKGRKAYILSTLGNNEDP